MGKTSSLSKQRWNSARYAQVNVQVAKETAAAFKASCKKRGLSIAGELSRFMAGAAAQREAAPAARQDGPRVETRGQRRKAVCGIIRSLQAICSHERQYMENIPENMQGGERHEDAESWVSALEDAISILDEAY
jgi:hypothetical protein